MSHQSEIEKEKYRNWVKGGLAYKYLKQGLDGFADDVVKQEQSRILSSINYTPGTICNQCIIERLRPIHACITNSRGNYECPWGQRKCNCLHLKKKKCRIKVCDFIMEEILKSHGSTPPRPNWANTDMQKWCTEPWEVGKCFINAPGYSNKTKAADIDISGLLHVFINNTSLHSHLTCSMAGKNIFIKVREGRNKFFHCVTMETEEREVAECIDDIVEILEDPKELGGRPEALEAVNKLKQDLDRMRLSREDDYDDDDFTSTQSQDSVSLDIASSKEKHSASYTKLFEPLQTMPVGATYQQTRASSSCPRVSGKRDIRYDHSPRPKQVPHPSLNRPTKPPLAVAEDFSPESCKPPKGRLNINSPGANRSNIRPGQTRLYHDQPRGHGQRSHNLNRYPIRSSNKDRLRDLERKPVESKTSSQGYNRYPDEKTRRSNEFLDKRDGAQQHYPQQGTKRTLPKENRYGNYYPANQNRYSHVAVAWSNPNDYDYKRPRSFEKALEMSEIMQSREAKLKEKKKSVYDSAYDISV